ncbi:MAG: polysaccharide deacetylase family protein [Flavisolibacter sp.]|nr:polysaccharide deacetylase family protein [Flavisolibacter sp.]
MKLLKRFYYSSTRFLPLQFLLRTSPVKSVFPYHHIVSDEEVPHISNLYPYKNTVEFKKDLEFLLKRFEPIHPTDLISFIENHNRLPEKKFLLTFDDGFKEIYEVVAPILKSKGVSAIFFINPAFIDNKEMFYRNKISVLLGEIKKQNQPSILKRIAEIISTPSEEYGEIRDALLKVKQANKEKLDEVATVLELSFEDYLRKKRPWLTTPELKELSSQGFYLGGHSWNHPYYQSLPFNEQVKQTIDSCSYVKQFQNHKTTFAFPHFDTDLSQKLFDRLLKTEHKIDLLFGTQNQKNEIQNKMIHRFNCERPGLPIDQHIKGILLYSILQKLSNKQNIIRKHA